MDILNDVLAALAIGLDALYPEVPILVELVPNQLPERCFLLGFAGEPEIRKATGERYEVTGKFDIAYICPEMEEDFQRTLNSMFINLSLNLGVIAYEGVTIRPGGFKRQVVDGVLHILCTFKTFLFRVDPTPTMSEVVIQKMKADS